MEIFGDWVKLALEGLLLSGGLILMSLGRRTDERLIAVSDLEPERALIQVGQKGRIGFGYPQVGAIAIAIWACLELFGAGIGVTAGISQIHLGFSTILPLLTVMAGIAMLQGRFTLDSVIWLLAVMILGSLVLMVTRDGGIIIALLHLIAVSIGWLTSTVSSLPLWGVSPLNRMTRPLLGEQCLMALLTAVLGVIICDVVNSERVWRLSSQDIFLLRAGIILMILGSWATIAQGIFVRSVLGMSLMAQGTLFVVWSAVGLGWWQLLAVTLGIDLFAGVLLFWSYQFQFGERETKELAMERKAMLSLFETTLTDSQR